MAATSGTSASFLAGRSSLAVALLALAATAPWPGPAAALAADPPSRPVSVDLAASPAPAAGARGDEGDDGGTGAPPGEATLAPAHHAATVRILDRLLAESTRAEGEAVRLSLAGAVRAAVENNPGIRANAEVPRSTAWSVVEATGAFDPTLSVSSTAERIKAPAGSALASGQQTFEEDSVTGSASISKLLRTGGTLGLDWTTGIIDTNSLFFRINPRYDNRLALSLRQPLLRGIGAIEENTTVLVAKAETERALAGFEAGLSDFVAETIDAYWAHVEAAADLEVARRSVALAEELVRDAEARVAVGLLAPVAVKEAKADAAARAESAIVAENNLAVAARVLQYRVMLGAVAERAPSPVMPAEEHVVSPVEDQRADAMRAAVEHRAEVRGAAIALDRRRLEEKLAKNGRLPDLDLVATYGNLGLRGDARPFVDENGNVQISPYDGSYSESLEDLFSNEYHDVVIGLEFEVPLGNAEAKARVEAAAIDVRRASRELEQAVSDVALDVDRALADVASAAKRVTASAAARDLAEENLRNQRRRYELGAVTTKDVLDFQERLAEAMAMQVSAISDHARAVTRLRQADGTLLSRFGIEVETPKVPGKPWWYRF